ncbi:Peroxisome assembly protein [Dirofilaria immitis]
MSDKVLSEVSRPKIIEMPILLEPPFPTFTPHPLRENLNKQLASLIFVNTSPHKLIFKIVPNSTAIRYSIHPEIDYLGPNACRLIGISISEAPQPKKEHDFTYKVLALNPTESFGISAMQYWEENRLEYNGQLHEAQFVCLEPEAELQLDSSHRIISRTSRDNNETKALLSIEYPKRIRRHTALLNHSTTSNDSCSDSPIYHRKQSVFEDIVRETAIHSKIQCHCQCHCTNLNHYFWQEAATMRSFFYGFVFAFICSALLIIRKNR